MVLFEAGQEGFQLDEFGVADLRDPDGERGKDFDVFVERGGVVLAAGAHVGGP